MSLSHLHQVQTFEHSRSTCELHQMSSTVSITIPSASYPVGPPNISSSLPYPVNYLHKPAAKFLCPISSPPFSVISPPKLPRSVSSPNPPYPVTDSPMPKITYPVIYPSELPYPAIDPLPKPPNTLPWSVSSPRPSHPIRYPPNPPFSISSPLQLMYTYPPHPTSSDIQIHHTAPPLSLHFLDTVPVTTLLLGLHIPSIDLVLSVHIHI